MSTLFVSLLAAYANAVEDLQRATEDYVRDPSATSEATAGHALAHASEAFRRVSEARALEVLSPSVSK